MTKRLIALFLICVFLSACTSARENTSVDETPNPTFIPSKDTVLFEIIPSTGDAIRITYGELLSFDQVTIEIEGKKESGIRLNDLLQKNGITVFHAVTASGGGRSVSLAPDQLNGKVLLTLTKNYTVKLISVDIPKSQWVTVNRIVIE